MRALEVRRIDGAEVLSNRRADLAGVDQLCDLVKERMLLGHVGGLQHRAREHRFPVDRHALAHQQCQFEWLVIDQREPALGRNQFDDLLEMICRVGGGEHDPGAPMPSAATCAAIGLPWSMT